MAKSSKAPVVRAEDATETKMTRNQFVEGLRDIHPDAHALAMTFFAGKGVAGRKNLKRFQAFSTNMKLTGNAQVAHQVLLAHGQPATITEWAELLGPYFEGKSTNLENVIRSNKQLLETVGAIEEVA